MERHWTRAGCSGRELCSALPGPLRSVWRLISVSPHLLLLDLPGLCCLLLVPLTFSRLSKLYTCPSLLGKDVEASMATHGDSCSRKEAAGNTQPTLALTLLPGTTSALHQPTKLSRREHNDVA